MTNVPYDEGDFDVTTPTENSVAEELTAYLDGELLPEQLQAVEDRLSHDEGYRKELQQLQKAWDLLDELPRTDSSLQFTKSTMEMVVQDAQRQVTKQRNKFVGWISRAALLLALPLFAFGASNAFVQRVQDTPNRELIENLELIHNVDLYRKARNIEYLIAISDLFNQAEDLEQEFSRLFDGDPTAIASIANIEELQELPSSQLNELRRKRKEFQQLTPESQQELRDFHLQLKSHENSRDLEVAMRRFYSWLKSFENESELNALLDAKGSKRIELTKKHYNQYVVDLFGKTSDTKLPMQDAENVVSWTKQTQIEKFPQVSEYIHLNPEAISRTRKRDFPSRTRYTERIIIWIGVIKHDPVFAGDLVFEEIDSLTEVLSQEAIDIFDSVEGKDRKTLVLNWMLSAMKAELYVSEKELMDFFYSDNVNPKEREALRSQNPENFFKALRIKYNRYHNRRRPRGVPSPDKPRRIRPERKSDKPGRIGSMEPKQPEYREGLSPTASKSWSLS